MNGYLVRTDFIFDGLRSFREDYVTEPELDVYLRGVAVELLPSTITKSTARPVEHVEDYLTWGHKR